MQSAKNNFDKDLLKDFRDQAKNPAVGDLSWSLFFKALVELIKENHPVASIITDVKNNRKNITNKHFNNLVFKAIQYIKIEENDLSYKDYKQSGLWKEEINKIFASKKKRAVFSKILNHMSVTTTIYERYIGPYAIISEYFDNRGVSVADLGCGGNHGLRGIDLKEPFKHFEDLTPGGKVKNAISKQINFISGLGIDKQNPDHKKVKAWRVACRFFPVELDGFSEFLEFENRLTKSKNVQFLEASITTLPSHLNDKFDAIILSLVLYQLSTPEQKEVIFNLRKLLKPDGIIIVQDYAFAEKSNPGSLNFNVSWYKKEFGFKTFLLGKVTNFEFKEILKWFDSRCAIVKEGKDFGVLFERVQLNNSSATLAQITS